MQCRGLMEGASHRTGEAYVLPERTRQSGLFIAHRTVVLASLAEISRETVGRMYRISDEVEYRKCVPWYHNNFTVVDPTA